MVGGDDDWTFCRNIAKAFNFGTKACHQKGRQERTQSSIRQVVEHGSNLVAIARYDTI